MIRSSKSYYNKNKKNIFFFIIVFLFVNSSQRKNDNPSVYYFKKLPFGFNGFIIPMVGIFLNESEKDNEMLYNHELVHWNQYQREGFFPFLFGYVSEHLSKGYDLNKYEIEARQKSGEDLNCITNYTECVRNGDSLTVQNKNFRNGR